MVTALLSGGPSPRYKLEEDEEIERIEEAELVSDQVGTFRVCKMEYNLSKNSFVLYFLDNFYQST